MPLFMNFDLNYLMPTLLWKVFISYSNKGSNSFARVNKLLIKKNVRKKGISAY
jgi:hypothetical protein